MSENRGDKLTYEQLEQANAELLRRVDALTKSLDKLNHYWYQKYRAAKKELRFINAAMKRKAREDRKVESGSRTNPLLSSHLDSSSDGGQ